MDGVPDFLRTDRPPWTANILEPYSDWGRGGPSTSQNFSSGSGGYSESVHINWNQPARDLPIYHWIVFENIHSAGRRACDDLLQEKRTNRMKSTSTCRNSIRTHLVTGGMTPWMIAGTSLFANNLCGEFPFVVSVKKIPSLV